jgi:CheY-like chemotaxis protein
MSDHVVLVVDDDQDIREGLVEILEERGYRAIGAANGVDALRILTGLDTTPCLILLDLMMPMMDGRTFRDEQRKHPAWAQIPVILMSAYQDVAQQAREMAVEHLPKPLGLETLMTVTRRHCPGN